MCSQLWLEKTAVPLFWALDLAIIQLHKRRKIIFVAKVNLTDLERQATPRSILCETCLPRANGLARKTPDLFAGSSFASPDLLLDARRFAVVAMYSPTFCCRCSLSARRTNSHSKIIA